VLKFFPDAFFHEPPYDIETMEPIRCTSPLVLGRRAGFQPARGQFSVAGPSRSGPGQILQSTYTPFPHRCLEFPTMKTFPTLILGLTLALSSVGHSQVHAPVRSISVTGTMKTKIAPDQILWHIQLTDTDVEMRKAKSASDERVKSVIGLREKLGVLPGDLETGTVNIRREYHTDMRSAPGDRSSARTGRSPRREDASG
jgi:hypothetical protein